MDDETYKKIGLYNKCIQIARIPRAGDVKRKVKVPETVGTHTLRCMQIALLYLPDSLKGEFYEEGAENFNKNKIIELLLIHDQGESVVGDIIRGHKTEEQKQQEAMAVKSIVEEIYSVTKGSCDSAEELYSLWLDMDSGHPQNINSKVAKEIDYIQGTHKYFYHVATKSVKFKRADLEEWLSEVSDERIKTKIGRKLRQMMIYVNAQFKGVKLLQEILRGSGQMGAD